MIEYSNNLLGLSIKNFKEMDGYLHTIADYCCIDLDTCSPEEFMAQLNTRLPRSILSSNNSAHADLDHTHHELITFLGGVLKKIRQENYESKTPKPLRDSKDIEEIVALTKLLYKIMSRVERSVLDTFSAYAEKYFNFNIIATAIENTNSDVSTKQRLHGLNQNQFAMINKLRRLVNQKLNKDSHNRANEWQDDSDILSGSPNIRDFTPIAVINDKIVVPESAIRSDLSPNKFMFTVNALLAFVDDELAKSPNPQMPIEDTAK